MTDNITALPPREARPERDAPDKPADVVTLGMITSLDTPAAATLAESQAMALDTCIVLGVKDGRLYVNSGFADGSEVLWLMRRFEHEMMKAADGVEP